MLSAGLAVTRNERLSVLWAGGSPTRSPSPKQTGMRSPAGSWTLRTSPAATGQHGSRVSLPVRHVIRLWLPERRSLFPGTVKFAGRSRTSVRASSGIAHRTFADVKRLPLRSGSTAARRSSVNKETSGNRSSPGSVTSPVSLLPSRDGSHPDDPGAV